MSGARAQRRVVVTATLVATGGVLPVFLVGPLAFLMRADFALTQARLGAAVAVYFAAAAVGAVPAGRLVERASGRSALALAALASGATLLALAATTSWAWLMGCMVASGLANSVSQLAANLRVSAVVDPARQGVAFGIKQGAIPASTLVAGAAVPAIALTVGWRWVFAAAAVVVLGLGLSQLRADATVERRRPGPARGTLAYAPLAVLAAAVAFGAAAATAMASFVVDYGVSAGVGASHAGVVLAAGSTAAVIMRVALGWLADRRPHGGNLLIVASMLAVGAVAVALLPAAATAGSLLAVTVVVYAVGWGWPGLFNFTIVRRNPTAPAAATGVTQVGVSIGGVAGPLTFGLVAERAGYATAWWIAAAWLAAAAALMLIGRRLARRAWLPQAPASSAG